MKLAKPGWKNWRLKKKLVAALEFALSAHGDQKRKGKDVPYVSHLLQVAGLVLEHGGVHFLEAEPARHRAEVAEEPLPAPHVFGVEVAGSARSL